jgi:hypothetical protein
VLTEKNAADDGEIRTIAARFFDVNPSIIERFPRFQELSTQRDGAWKTGRGTGAIPGIVQPRGWTDWLGKSTALVAKSATMRKKIKQSSSR